MTVLAAFLLNTIFNFFLGLLVAYFLGPAEFGRFALALAIGAMTQSLVLDWIRLSALRFFSGAAHANRPELAPTLDFSLVIMSVCLSVLAAAVLLSGIDLPPSRALFGVAIAASIANGLFDYRSALLRAQFLDRAYARLMLIKNVMAITLTVGAAFLTGSAFAALVGACVSMAGSVVFASRAWRLEINRFRGGKRSIALDCAHYAMPIVVANVLYAGISLINRYLMMRWYGFAETGYFSLASDLGGRLIGAVGTALDALLFQLAVKADEHHGRHAAQEQVARNLTVVFTILTPAAVGFWLILPSIEALLAPPSFRGHFAAYLELLLPGLYCQGMATYAINAVFQIQKNTRVIVAAAFVGFAVNALLLFLMASSSQPSTIPIAQSVAYAAAFFCLVGLSFVAGAKRPALLHLFYAAVGVAVMTLALLPMRDWTPGVGTLATQVLTGGVIMVAFIMMFNIAGLRPILLQAIRQVAARRA
ncbi:MAG: lipopolysaccharide biosynthesis protein [Beijerinckiaceae bacterium]|nr:lipopolysaccharide biosynthesis protein [Beijerinckiaceae bacterium]